MSRRNGQVRSVPADAVHGAPVTYDWWGCRCVECREAHRLYRKRLREGRQPSAKVSSLGTARRLQALAAIGYSFRDVAARLSIAPTRVGYLARPGDAFVLRETAVQVAVLFERLAAVPGQSKYTVAVARRHGWLPPLAWDAIDDPEAAPDTGQVVDEVPDPVAVERALSGERLRLTGSEKEAALLEGLARGMSLSRTALTLGINYPTAQKIVELQDQLAS